MGDFERDPLEIVLDSDRTERAVEEVESYFLRSKSCLSDEGFFEEAKNLCIGSTKELLKELETVTYKDFKIMFSEKHDLK
jgi:hypothetical protein